LLIVLKTQGEGMKAIVLNVIGTILIIPGLLGLVLVSKDATLSMRFGGPGGGVIGSYQASAMLVDAAIAAVFFAIGGFLLRHKLQQTTWRTVLIIAAVVAVLLGINAGRIS
jgi:hypothetical protein